MSYVNNSNSKLNHFLFCFSEMGKTTSSRDWTQIYAIYGVDQWQTVLFLLFHALLFSVLSLLYLFYFDAMGSFFESVFSLIGVALPGGAARFAAGFTGSVTAISAVCLFFAAANFFYSAVPLHHEMALRMVSAVNDWSTVKHALDLGCGRGIQLNAVATQLKKEGLRTTGKTWWYESRYWQREMRTDQEIDELQEDPTTTGVAWWS